MRPLSMVSVVVPMLSLATAHAERKGLVAHWDFSEGKGDVLHDRSGNEIHGKLIGNAEGR